MLKVFDEVRKNVKFSRKLVIIDNLAFRAHYKFTFAALLVCTVLVSSQQYIGEHIRCIADKGLDDKNKVIETFCFFTATFTVVRHLNSSVEEGGMVPHPGVGPMMPSEPIVRHAYYQWVPFVLFAQALLFYLPHFLWKRIEGGRIKSMASGFEHAALASRDTPTKVDKTVVPSRKDLEGKLVEVRTSFLQRLHINRMWALGLVVCEILNLLNVVMQVWLMDAFLGGQFIGLGDLATGASPDDDVLHPMDIVFPKVTKCTFHKYGPSGSIQNHDALCVMALNVVNEKIYVFLWFWCIILFAITALALLFRLACFILYSRSMGFNMWLAKYVCAVPLDPISMQTIMQECYFSDWLILHYLALSMDGFVYKELYDGLAMEIEENRKTGSFRSDAKQDNGWNEDEKELLEKEPLKKE